MSQPPVATSQSENTVDYVKKEDVAFAEFKVSKFGSIGKTIHECVNKIKTDSNHRTIKISGLAAMIPKVIEIVEGVKRQLGFLHQINEITYHEFNDEESKEGDAKKPRNVEMLTITLSQNGLDRSAVGYQKPSPIQGRAYFKSETQSKKPSTQQVPQASEQPASRKRSGKTSRTQEDHRDQPQVKNPRQDRQKPQQEREQERVQERQPNRHDQRARSYYQDDHEYQENR